MTSERYNIDKLFGEKFSGADVKPDANVWNRISNGLNRMQYRRRKMGLWFAAASIALFASFGAGYFIALHQMQNTDFVAEQSLESAVIIEESFASNDFIIEDARNEAPSRIHQIENKSVELTQVSKKGNLSKIMHKSAFITETVEEIERAETVIVPEKAAKSQRLPSRILIPAIPSIGKAIAYNYDEIQSPDLLFDLKETKSERRWSISGQAAPMYSYRDLRSGNSNVYTLANNLHNNESMRNFESDKSYYNTVETPLIAFSGGINTAYQFSNRLSVQSGLYYSRMGQINNEIFVVEEERFYGSTLQVINSSAGDVKSDNHEGMLFNKFRQSEVHLLDESSTGSLLYQNNSSLILHFDYLEIPLMLKYRLFGKAVSFSLGGGISTSFLVNNKAHIQTADQKIDVGKTHDISSTLLNGLVGFSIDYKLNENICFVVEPQYRQSLTTLNNSYYIESFPRALSVLGGLKYAF